jgi:hypothetical protein
MLKPRPMNGRWKQLTAAARAKPVEAAPVKATVEATESADTFTATDDEWLEGKEHDR